MRIQQPEGHYLRWRKGFAILPTFLGKENGQEISVWFEVYQWRYVNTGAPYELGVEYRPINASPTFETHVDTSASEYM